MSRKRVMFEYEVPDKYSIVDVSFTMMSPLGRGMCMPKDFKVEDVEEKVGRCVSVMDHVRLQCPTCKEYTVKPLLAPLKPCGECSGDAVCLKAGWFWIAGCSKCGRWESSDISKEMTMYKWNMRTP